MPTLDSTAFSTVLTPEAAIDLVQKEIRKKGWAKFDLGDIKLVYTPFWIFNYDVAPAGAQPQSGRAALNAFTGDLDDLVPELMEKALKKTREVEAGAEIDQTAVREDEVRGVAQTKIAGMTGAKREEVSISAVSKIYAPFFKVFVDIKDESYRVDVDAAMGAPVGLEEIPARAKTWTETADETIRKMLTPSGFAQLLSQTFAALGGKGAKGIDWSKRSTQLGAILVVAIILIGIYLALPRGLAFSCAPDSDLVQKTFLGDTLTPRAINNGAKLQVTGSCTFENRGGGTETACSTVTITEDGSPPEEFVLTVENKPSTLVCSGQVGPQGKLGVAWTATWNNKPGVKTYALSYGRV